MRITGLLTDDAVLAELGARITGRRVELQLTQAAVAEVSDAPVNLVVPEVAEQSEVSAEQA